MKNGMKIYDLAKMRWPECLDDPSKLADRLADLVLQSGIYIDKDSRLLGNGDGSKDVRYAIINVYDKVDPVFGGVDNPRLFRGKEAAKAHALTNGYQDWDDEAIDELVIPWKPTHFDFAHKGSDTTISLSKPNMETLESSNIQRKSKLSDKIRDIIDPATVDDQNILRRGMYNSLEDLTEKISEVRNKKVWEKHRWIKENKGRKTADGPITLKRKGKNPVGKKKLAKTGEVSFKTEISLELVDILLDLLDKENPSVSEVLCGSHVWRTHQPEMQEEPGEPRRALLSRDDIGCRVGDELSPIITDMVRFQFSIQPVFDKYGEQIGSLELKRMMRFMEKGGNLPIKVSINQLRELELLGPHIPLWDPNTRSEIISDVLSRHIDAVLFHWKESRDSLNENFPKEFRGVLEDGLHIITSHDYMAYRIWKDSNKV